MSELDSNIHDIIAQLCFKQFDKLPKTGKPKETEWTILSCIIMENEKNLEVVALGTGTKCIGRDKMSKDGDILNDSHAEVICRRVFLRYLYENMLQDKSDVLQFMPEEQKFKIADNIKFHFFSTQVPCGDAAIFPKNYTGDEDIGDLIDNVNTLKRKYNRDDVDNTKKRKVDIFRTGAKCLENADKKDLKKEGVNFHITGVVRTKPGRGVPTLSVSCSDKLAKWCHLGVQGALLRIVLKDPLYFSSFTICGGTPYNEEALKRALFGRLNEASPADLVFGQSKLEFEYKRTPEKTPCPASIVWLNVAIAERQTEVSVDGRRQGVTKKQLKINGALKISKKELFKKFIDVIKQRGIELQDIKSTKVTYKAVKMCSVSYQRQWDDLRKKFRVWTVKDPQLLNFTVL